MGKSREAIAFARTSAAKGDGLIGVEGRRNAVSLAVADAQRHSRA
jgi:hypothetical protein